MNSVPWAANNIVGSPSFLDNGVQDYRIAHDSPARNAGTQPYTTSGATDVYQQFIDRYTGDPDFPGNSADVWPKDYRFNERVLEGTIDIGPFEYP